MKMVEDWSDAEAMMILKTDAREAEDYKRILVVANGSDKQGNVGGPDPAREGARAGF